MAKEPYRSRLSGRYQQIKGYITAIEYTRLLISKHLCLTLGAKINGFALLMLDENELRQFGVSFGFRVTLVNIIENLVSDSCGNVCML